MPFSISQDFYLLCYHNYGGVKIESFLSRFSIFIIKEDSGDTTTSFTNYRKDNCNIHEHHMMNFLEVMFFCLKNCICRNWNV